MLSFLYFLYSLALFILALNVYALPEGIKSHDTVCSDVRPVTVTVTVTATVSHPPTAVASQGYVLGASPLSTENMPSAAPNHPYPLPTDDQSCFNRKHHVYSYNWDHGYHFSGGNQGPKTTYPASNSKYFGQDSSENEYRPPKSSPNMG